MLRIVVLFIALNILAFESRSQESASASAGSALCDLVQWSQPAVAFGFAKEETLQLIQKRHPTATDIQIVPKRENGQTYLDLKVATSDGDSFRLDETYMYFWIESGGELGINVSVHPNYRKMGLNRLFMLYSLMERPHISRLKNEFVASNRSAFVAALLHPDDQAMQRQLFNLLESADANDPLHAETSQNLIEVLATAPPGAAARELRELIITAYSQHTPGGRISHQLGFNNIIELRVMQYPGRTQLDGNLVVIAERGEAANHLTKVFIDRSHVGQAILEILPTGAIKEHPAKN